MQHCFYLFMENLIFIIYYFKNCSCIKPSKALKYLRKVQKQYKSHRIGSWEMLYSEHPLAFVLTNSVAVVTCTNSSQQVQSSSPQATVIGISTEQKPIKDEETWRWRNMKIRLSWWRYLDTDILYKSINFERLNKIYSFKKSFMYGSLVEMLV